MLPLRTFIQETLRRSRTSYSTLQVALYYLILIKPHVPKHNFTMEQPEDRQSDRALQCGRRMFLSALILASKYLQDRNYSARAWSKISGLNTQEINQNEISFLLAVNWKLHITDEVFQKWTELVLKFTPPPSPPSPDGVSPIIAAQRFEWKQLILQLAPDLCNVENLGSATGIKRHNDLSSLSPRSILNATQEETSLSPCSASPDATPQAHHLPVIMEPNPSILYTPNRLVPTMGTLPTPRLTPQLNGFCAPAVGAATQLLGKNNCTSMSLAMAQVSMLANAQNLDRCPTSVTSSPQSYCSLRRSSLATIVSTASSPESMVSDASQSSRSSISSASSLVSATLNQRLNVPSRSRSSKLCNERLSVKPRVPSVPEDYDESCYALRPDFHTAPAGKIGDLTLESPLARREREMEMCQDASEAAKALQDLHNQGYAAPKTGCKRTRTASMDAALHDNVREILSGQIQISPKRLCCAVEAAHGYQNAAALRSRGIWDAILN